MLIAVDARGEDRPTVVLVSSKACCTNTALPEIERRLATEMAALGYRLETILGTATTVRARRIELGVVAEEEQAVCAFRVLRQENGPGVVVELWVTRHGPGEAYFDEVRVVDSGEETAALIALKSVEIIKARAVDKRANVPSPTPPPVTPAAEPRISTSPPAPVKLGISAAIGLVGSASRAPPPPLPVVAVSARWRILPKIALGLSGGRNMGTTMIRRDGNSASLSLLFARGEVTWHTPVAAFGFAGIGAAGGLFFPSVHGIASQSHDAHSFAATLGYAGGKAELGYDLGLSMRISVAARLGTTFKEIGIVFEPEEVARFGPLIWDGLLSLEFGVAR